MDTKDIFTALAKYNSARDENYLTEAFVFVLNSLLSYNRELDRACACEFLTKLCARDNEFGFGQTDIILVSTQDVTDEGTPDIKVFTPDKFIYIEVKHDSPLGDRQISRYKKALEHSLAPIKKVVLLTRFPIDFKDGEEKPYKHVRWYEVYNWISMIRAQVKDPANVYLIDSFLCFLEEKQMSIQKVGWEYINGVPALLNLINMIEVAIESAGIPLYREYPRATALDWRGFYLKSNEIWCGIYYSDPLNICLQLVDKKKFDIHRVAKSTYDVEEDKKSIWFSLGLEDCHFFSLNKDEQLEVIMKFVKISYEEANKMRLP
jgi:hypothetical protein